MLSMFDLSLFKDRVNQIQHSPTAKGDLNGSPSVFSPYSIVSHGVPPFKVSMLLLIVNTKESIIIGIRKFILTNLF